ncbi:DNA cytosine methyltransferase [Microbulbifer variabilis]|uniref:DNA (cytosine-5-)-methyltransferase n=1 Tax=Microbulbifer variabilis TaxID=266805 RepID=A0ABY4VJP3_9GAMM|nr:DNA cytosine methyltransferase [Microbulbifer variabilis]USD22119.1 DNA cytosine methyltransferase [Microbulbifer variabilis]
MKFGSVCSGIEAASVAWEQLGWHAIWFAEIEPFPSAVLAHHWPEVRNLGDMTKIATEVLRGTVEAPEVLVGGTPCQAFSVSGMREGLSDPRGQLTIKYVELLDAIDHVRTSRGEQKTIAVWENVPGVLSSKDNAFGCFLAELAGDDNTLTPGPQPEPGRSSAHWQWCKKTRQHFPVWSKSGHVIGPRRTIAWRVLDAQYFGVAQRRRRVFLVASAREGFDPAAILFEREGLRRDSAPSRETPQEVAGTITAGAGRRRGAGIEPEQLTTGTLTATYGEQSGRDLAEMPGGLLPVAFGQNRQSGPVDVSHAVTAHAGRQDFESETFLVQPAIAFPAELSGTQCAASENLSPALSVTHTTAVAFAQNSRDELRESPLVGTLSSGGGKPSQGFAAVRQGLAARRLTPVECERLQGFPDNHTLIPLETRKKVETEMVAYYSRQLGRELTAEECDYLASDGPRYKAIGNSKAVPVVRWIGKKIKQALKQLSGDCNQAAA